MSALRRRPAANVLREEDLTPQMVSWCIALTIATVWLTVVRLTPLPVALPKVIFEPGPLIMVPPTSGNPLLRRIPEGKLIPVPGQAKTRAVVSEAKLAGIFAADLAEHAVDDVAKLIPGVQTARTETEIGAQRRKTALDGGTGDQRPAMSGFAGNSLGTGRTGSVGSVEHTVAIDRADFHARPLAVVSAPPLENATADATELGAFVRGRVAQLQSCYERSGGTDLAGVVALRLTIGVAGVVRSAEIVRRSWSGPGAADTEACLIRMASGWHVPSAQQGTTVTLPISFTRGG